MNYRQNRNMSNTRIISVRIPVERYEEILLLCAEEGIGVSEWMYTRILLLEKILLQMENLRKELNDCKANCPYANGTLSANGQNKNRKN